MTTDFERLRGEVVGLPLAPREVLALAAYARLGWMQGAADDLGLSPQTVKNYLRSAYAKLDAHSGIDAFHKLGWLRIPDDKDVARYYAAAEIGDATDRLAERVDEVSALLNELRTPASTRGVSPLNEGRSGGLIAANPASSYTAPPSWRQPA